MRHFPDVSALLKGMKNVGSEVLEVSGLCKRYSGFALENVSFSLKSGTITGFIGRNGAGKTTTLHCLLHLTHPDEGHVSFFGEEFAGHEAAIKNQIGYVSGGVSYYPRKPLKTITAVNRRFYSQWDDAVYLRCLEEFSLDERKTPTELSEGMKVKYALTLALSHHARLLILDEPTSGLDPVSREDLLELFLRLRRREDAAILFSTHITSDLDNCADRILYLRDGRLVADAALDEFTAGYWLLRTKERPESAIGPRENRTGWTALLAAGDAVPAGGETVAASLEDIMVHLEKGEWSE